MITGKIAHAAHLERPDEFAREARAFLLGPERPDAISEPAPAPGP